MTGSTVRTNLTLLRTHVPSNYQYAVRDLADRLGANFGDTTPISIDQIRTHIGDFEANWVRDHRSCHMKPGDIVATQTAPTTESVPTVPVEQNVLHTPVAATTAPQVIGGKRVPPVNPEKLVANSSTVSIDIDRTRNGNQYEYDGVVTLDLTKMQQVQVQQFAATVPEGAVRTALLRLANEGKISLSGTAEIV